jgi:hypothetical protein
MAVPNAQLTVSDVSVDPAEPTAGEPFTLTSTIQNSVGSDQAATIDFVRVEIDGEQVANRTNNGALSPGDSLDVPVTTTIADPGEYTATITVSGTDESGERVTVDRVETLVVSPVPQVRLTVDGVDVTPETPTVGAPVTVPITVSSSGGSTQPLDVDAVRLQNDTTQFARAENVGALSAGESITVPLTTTFERAGEHSLTVVLEGTNTNNQSVSVSQPLSVAVEPGEPALEFAGFGGVENVPTELPVTVSNPTETTLRNIVVTVGGDDIVGRLDRRVVPTLAPGNTVELSFVVRPERAGDALLETNLSYTTASGTDATLERTAVLPVEPLEESVSVRVSPVVAVPSTQGSNLGVDVGGILDTGGGDGDEQPETGGDIRVTVSNLGNAPIERVVLDPRAGDTSLGPRPVATRLEPGAEQSVVLSLDGTPPTELVFEASYELAGNRATATTTFDPGASQGSVAVTGVDLETDGQRTVITGDLGNPGEGDISGVIVSVEEGDGVTPAYPSRDFFVGALESNAFAPFELTATLDGNATTIPLEVTYLVSGDERTETVQIPVKESPSTDDSDEPSLLLVGGVFAVLGSLFVLILVLTRRS